MTNPNQPSYGQPAPDQPQYGQPSYGQPQYGQPQNGLAPQYGQPQNAQAPQYGHPGYQPMYPGYSRLDPGPSYRSNPAAGILLLIGVLAGLGACFLPYDTGSVAAHGGGNDLPLITAITHLPDVIESASVTSSSWQYLVWSLSIIVLALGVLFCLIAGLLMFAAARRRHAGAASTGLVGALIMLGAPIMMVVATEGYVFDYLDLTTILALGAWLPAMVGAIIGFTR